MATNLTIKQGETFRKKWTYCGGFAVVTADGMSTLQTVGTATAEVTKAIASITLGYPTVFTATAHGLPTGPLPVAILNVTDLETDSALPADRIIATKVATDTFSINVDSSDFTTYTSGGILVYNAPIDLTSYLGRCMFRQTVGSTATILDVDNVDTGIVLGTTEGTVELVLTAAQTAALTLTSMVYDIEIESAGGVVTRIASGTVTLDKEVTRP
jgi:hypothetical protein